MTEHKTFGRPDETREFPNGRVEILKVGGGQVGRLVLKPGWRWSNDVKLSPIPKAAKRRTSSITSAANSESGWMTAREFVAGPGDITSLPSGHDAWVVGDEPVVVVDWFGASNYAKV
jgi:hypothetical protein